MKSLIVFAHPNPNSFNYALVAAVEKKLRARGDEVRKRDLYSADFNPVLDSQQLAEVQQGRVPSDVAEEQHEVVWADNLIFIYPLWWFDRPALLKGWFDRVFTNGFAFAYEAGQLQGRLGSKRVMIVITTGGSEADFGADADQLCSSGTRATLSFCGVDQIIQKVFYAVPAVDDAARQAMLLELENLTETL
ncbi:MAG: NAD(P)H-dependent oxidoreductase [Gammaproteobacteria bacterium]|nr:NAD(P)H-dependent oxidoreductase [Gammaproteobacteria bacterium]